MGACVGRARGSFAPRRRSLFFHSARRLIGLLFDVPEQRFRGWVVDDDSYEGLAPVRLLERERVDVAWETEPFSFAPVKQRAEPETPPVIKVRHNDFGPLDDDTPYADAPGLPSPDMLDSLRATMPGAVEVPAPFHSQPRERPRRDVTDFDAALTITNTAQLGTALEVKRARGGEASHSRHPPTHTNIHALLELRWRSASRSVAPRLLPSCGRKWCATLRCAPSCCRVANSLS